MRRKVSIMEGGPVSENGFEHSVTIAEMRSDVQSCDLHGLDVIEAERVTDRFLDKAFRENFEVVKIIHGKGQGFWQKPLINICPNIAGLNIIDHQEMGERWGL